MNTTGKADHIHAMCDEFAERHFTEENIQLWCESGGLPRKVYRDFYECGLGGYALPVIAGGIDAPFLDRITMLERLTRRAGAVLPIQTDMLTLALLSTMRDQSQMEIIEDLFPKQDGTVIFSQAFTEPGAGSDALAIQTTVSAEGDKLFLDGLKTFVTSGQFAPRTLVLARDPICGRADGGLSLWLVSLDLPGISAEPVKTIGQEMLCPAAVTFDHVLLDPEWQIQTEGKLGKMLKREFALGRILVCASSLGLAKAALDDALTRASEHQVKGRTLGTLPQIQERIAHMAIKVRAMETFVYEAASSVKEDDLDALILKSSMMKSFVPKTATEVASTALQIFGGIGYTDESRVGRIWKDCRGNQIAQGTDEVMVHYIATRLVNQAAKGEFVF
ncbi:MAG: acyl-CoA dehydrogenase family protein [Eggerthellaceae bacterium]